MAWEPSNRVDLDPLKQEYWYFVGDFVHMRADREVYIEHHMKPWFEETLNAWMAKRRPPIHHRYLPLPLEPVEGFGI